MLQIAAMVSVGFALLSLLESEEAKMLHFPFRRKLTRPQHKVAGRSRH
jgi:hypothetical protein